ncbi:unnamed protein product [Schistosoma turkestanicum]|nr:unnamed protein product [Schistosoma turkestanicum]
MSSGGSDETKTSNEFDKGFLAESNQPLESSRFSIAMKMNRDKDKSTLLPPSPPKFVSMNQLAEAAEAFYNMSLAHEITVDSQFRLEKYEPQEKSLEYCIKETMHRAFWDILRSSLECDPPDYQPVLRLLEEVKQSLQGLVLPNQVTLKTLIENLLDMDIARSQLEETGYLSLEMYKTEVINLMKQFCAPIRDQEVENLRNINDPIEAFKNVFILLDKMHMDLANFTIEQMRPYIRQQAVTYERTKFAAFLEAQQKLGIDGLAHTRDWIKQAYNDLLHVSSSSSSHQSTVHEDNSSASNNTNNISNISVDMKKSSNDCTTTTSTTTTAASTTSTPTPTSNDVIPLTPNNILREAYLKLLTWPRDCDWPETMLMDQYRLIDLGNQLLIIVNLTSIILVVCNYVATNLSSTTTTATTTTPPPTLTNHQSSSPSSLPSTHTSKSIFSMPANHSPLPSYDVMIQLKKSICQDVALVLHGIALNYKPDQLIDDVIEQVILTIELWYNRCILQSATPCGAVTSSPSPSSTTVATSNEQKLSCTPPPPTTTAYITDYGRHELTVQLTSVITAEHPVYKLMHKRAMDFLRSALSSYPPEPLTLPPGFSVLLDLDQTKLNSSIQNSGSSYLQKSPMNIPTTTPTTTMMFGCGASTSSSSNQNHPSTISGLQFPPSPSTPPLQDSMSSSGKTMSKLEILSLSDLASRLLPLLAHNRHVFGVYYAEIIQLLLMPEIRKNTS